MWHRKWFNSTCLPDGVCVPLELVRALCASLWLSNVVENLHSKKSWVVFLLYQWVWEAQRKVWYLLELEEGKQIEVGRPEEECLETMWGEGGVGKPLDEIIQLTVFQVFFGRSLLICCLLDRSKAVLEWNSSAIRDLQWSPNPAAQTLKHWPKVKLCY